MAVVSGQVTFGTTGIKNVILGISINDLDTDGPLMSGHADVGNQFSRQTIGAGEKDPNRCIVIKNTSGVKVVEAKVTGGWGTPTLTFDCTIANASFPFELTGRT